MNSTRLKVGLICGGTSGEHQVSLISAYHIQKALDRNRFDVRMIGISQDGSWFLGDSENFLENHEDVRKVAFTSSLPVTIPERQSLVIRPENSGSLDDIDVFFPITHGRL